MKICTKCLISKEDNEFLKGYNRCKVCELPRIKRNGRNKRAKNPRLYNYHAKELRLKNLNKFRMQDSIKRNKDPRKALARQIVRLAVKGGWLIRPTICSKCRANNKRIDGHHIDYNNPLNVEWLCSTCHGLTFRK